jgi:uncharacterized protein (DUF1330 family)
VKHYAVAEINITDARWIRDYVKHVTPLVEQYGGRYLARTSNLEQLEGERPAAQMVLIIEWPSREAALAFYSSDEYRPHRDGRRSGSTGEFLLVAGEDINGVARM